MIRRALGGAVVVAAIVAALLPMPRAWIERWYSERLYASLQRSITPVSNRVDWSLFDAVCIAGAAMFVLIVTRSLGGSGWIRGGVRALWRAAVFVSFVYLAFLGTWGLNYRRVPLASKVAFDRSRVTRDATVALAARAAAAMNALHAPAHARPFSAGDLIPAFHAAQHALGSQWSLVPAPPKRTLLSWYFRRAAIAGMTDPFLLEVMLAPDLLDVERPFALAHEWGHLAGYADESEANFIAWLTCARGDERAQYSGWLGVFGYAVHALPAEQRRAAFAALGPGPRADLAAIAARYAATSPIVRAAAQQTYDRYLKANRVEEGIESYDVVLQLILGTPFDDNWTPRLR